MLVQSAIIVAVYLIACVFAARNVKQYLICQQRYKSWNITYFYILAFSVLLSRIMMEICFGMSRYYGAKYAENPN
jgi:hypothetical protein